MSKAQDKIGKSALSVRHARTLDEHGKIIPRCGKYRGTRQQLDLMVTANPKRVSCECCKGLVQ
jgi:hypothetical protein